MNKEWQILSQKFSQVCQENTQLSRQVDTLSKALGETQQQTEQLLSQNKELGNRLTEEVLALSRKVSEEGEEEGVLEVDRNDNEQITPTKVSCMDLYVTQLIKMNQLGQKFKIDFLLFPK